MTEMTKTESTNLAEARCSSCDREVTHYNTFISSTDEKSVICWQCLSRTEKGFNADRNFHRTSRRGVIPR